jgi:hypothetical protein
MNINMGARTHAQNLCGKPYTAAVIPFLFAMVYNVFYKTISDS